MSIVRIAVQRWRIEMERLTRKDGNGKRYVGDDFCYDSWAVPKKFYGDAIDRLAHYEDLEEQGRLVVLKEGGNKGQGD